MLFLFYTAFLSFAVMNVLTGIFVENALKVGELDRDNVIREELRREKSSINSMKGLFREMDDDGSGLITWGQFQTHMDKKDVRNSFSALDIGASDARTLFTLLDVDGTNAIDIDEFVNGLIKVKGDARSIDMITLMHN